MGRKSVVELEGCKLVVGAVVVGSMAVALEGHRILRIGVGRRIVDRVDKLAAVVVVDRRMAAVGHIRHMGRMPVVVEGRKVVVLVGIRMRQD